MPSHNVTVIIPTYNRWPRVQRAIDSVLAQNIPTLPLVVDDASTDGTADRLREFYGNNIKLICQTENREKSAARNAGLAGADTAYLGFLDSDDEWAPHAVESLLAVFERDPDFSGVAYGACNVNEQVEIPPEQLPQGKVLHEYVRKPFLHTMSFLIPRNLMTELNGYREDLTNLEDVELFIRMMARYEFRSCATVIATIHKQADSASVNFEKVADQGTLLLNHLNEDRISIEALGADLEIVEHRVYRELLRALYKCGRAREFLTLYRRLKHEHPGYLRDVAWHRYAACRLRALFS